MNIKILPKVSIIVAVYNVEAYIEKCADSLFGQTLDSIEYIFIDDCSTDRSIELLKSVVEKYPDRKNWVRIIRNSRNSQVAYTRTVGMKAAVGEYVIHCDPDDYVESDYYKTLYDAAIASGADIVASNYFRESNESIEVIRSNYYSEDPTDCIKNIHRSYFFPSLWLHLVKRSIYVENNIYPYEGINTGEDLNVILRIFSCAKKLVYIDQAFYHYVMRSSSLTQNNDYFALWENNITPNLRKLGGYFESNYGDEYLTMLNFFKFTKKQILLSVKPAQTLLWYNTYPECRRDLLKFTSMSLFRRIVYLVFSYSYQILNLYFKVRYNFPT